MAASAYGWWIAIIILQQNTTQQGNKCNQKEDPPKSPSVLFFWRVTELDSQQISFTATPHRLLPSTRLWSRPSVWISPGNKGPSCHFKPENLSAQADAAAAANDDDEEEEEDGDGDGDDHGGDDDDDHHHHDHHHDDHE